MKPRPGWLILVALAAACRQTAPAPLPKPVPKLASTAIVNQATVYLVAVGDRGHHGQAAGCGDSVVPVSVRLPQPGPALEADLTALLAMRQEHDAASGLVNPLYASQLSTSAVERGGKQALIHLTGYLELGSRCDNARMRAELESTARQFSDLTAVRFEVDDEPLETVWAQGSKGSFATGGTESEPARAAPAPGDHPAAPASPDSAPGPPPP